MMTRITKVIGDDGGGLLVVVEAPRPGVCVVKVCSAQRVHQTEYCSKTNMQHHITKYCC